MTTLLTFSVVALSSAMCPLMAQAIGIQEVKIGNDLNSAANPVAQPQEKPLAGNGIDQTMQFGDVLEGTDDDDVLIGRLGIDVMFGGNGDDVLIGGPEHFNPQNRDRAFGGNGDDVFIWSPGDGSDFFDGGRGKDVLVFGLIQQKEGDIPVLAVRTDQKAGEVILNANSSLPTVDVTRQPGFCQIIDKSAGAEVAAELEKLGVTHLVRFFVRGPANSFAAGEQDTDNGLRVTLHVKNVEQMVCTSRNGGQIETFDLTVSPAAPVSYFETSARVQAMVQ
ncbi:MAG: calcium-binding protein [Bryobacteraceae bacterium]